MKCGRLTFDRSAATRSVESGPSEPPQQTRHGAVAISCRSLEISTIIISCTLRSLLSHTLWMVCNTSSNLQYRARGTRGRRVYALAAKLRGVMLEIAGVAALLTPGRGSSGSIPGIC